MILDGEEILVRPHLGLFTQPLSFIGLPVLSVPIQRKNALPLGVQLIAAPYNENGDFKSCCGVGENGSYIGRNCLIKTLLDAESAE